MSTTDENYFLPKHIRNQDNVSVSSEDSEASGPIRSAYHAINERSALLNGHEVVNHGGLTTLGAAIFVAGEMAGSGVLALPRAVVDTGIIGLLLLVVFGINSGYSGARLGDCWAMIEERYPEHRVQTRDPYSVIAERAVGQWGRKLVSACVQITLFGVSTVYILIASQMIKELLVPWYPNVNFCYCYVIFVLLLTPVTWLGSPKDFWFIGIGALLTTSIACVFIVTQLYMDALHLEGDFPPHKVHSFHDFFSAFGILLFAFGGASTFPTIQNDMIQRNQFPRSISIAFTAILCLYIPVTFGGYLVYGEATNANIVLSLGKTSLATFANIFMATHLILAFLIVINPVAQQVEQNFNCPHHFCLKRIIIRSCLMLGMIVLGELIPSFGKILALIGGSTVTLTTFILPSYFYMKLCDERSDVNWPVREIPLHMRVYMYEMIFIGLLGGICTSYNAILSIITDPMSKFLSADFCKQTKF
uniref:Amino acid transporter ANT1 n=1 Tax=Cacopsylla melanoneura TaxID=428564 RepID=A0A8D8V9U2_9HEMI